mmetsp:Transcript_16100/g.28942  ORF Transcript_16100/g.28942 Transcript_16100/m.28942 type:complete len:535 (-) Transcript_16100:334-1938(-)
MDSGGAQRGADALRLGFPHVNPSPWVTSPFGRSLRGAQSVQGPWGSDVVLQNVQSKISSGRWTGTSVIGESVIRPTLIKPSSLAEEHDYDYVLIVDAEAVEKKTNPRLAQNVQMQIEVAWITISLKASKGATVLNEKQRYCVPNTKKVLSSSRLNLGQNGQVLKREPEIRDVLKELQSDANALISRSKSFALIANREANLKSIIEREIKGGNFKIPDCFQSIYDIRAIFTKCSGIQRPSLKRMLSAHQLQFEGQLHSGFDNCKNAAKMVVVLVNEGYRFKKTDLIKFGISFQNPKENSKESRGQSSTIAAQFTYPDRVVRIRGLPWKATIQDVERFFTPLPLAQTPNPIQLTKDSLGRPSGCGYVEFGNREAAQWAIQTCHMRYLMDRYIEVFPLVDEEKTQEHKKTDNSHQNSPLDPFSKASADLLKELPTEKKKSSVSSNSSTPNFGPTAASNANKVRLRGLPWSATKEQVIKFFEPLSLADHDQAVQLMKNKRGRPSGLAIVEFASYVDALQAKNYDRKYMGKRYIEVHPL